MGTTAVNILKVLQCHLVPSKYSNTYAHTQLQLRKVEDITKQCTEIALIIFIDETDIHF
jgi:hypothetical protein